MQGGYLCRLRLLGAERVISTGRFLERSRTVEEHLGLETLDSDKEVAP